MKKIKPAYFIWLAIIVVIAVLLIIRIDFSGEPAVAGGRGGANADPLPVHAVVVKQQPLDDNIVAAGSILPNEQVELVIEASGKINRIAFTEGAAVEKGQLLVQVNNADLQAQLSRAEAQLKLRQDMENRQRQMLARGGVSQSEFDVAIAELASAEADVHLLRAQIAKTQVRAPFSGTIGLRRVSEGSFVSSNTVVATLVSTNPAKIEFSVPERYSSEIENGATISFTVDGIDDEFTGKIFAIEPRIDANTRTVLVRAESDNRTNKLVPGAFARVEINLRRVDDALMVPNQAIIPELNSRKVFVLKNGKVEPKVVETGIRTADLIQVTSGLADGDTVVTTGLLQLRPGMPVRLTQIN